MPFAPAPPESQEMEKLEPSHDDAEGSYYESLSDKLQAIARLESSEKAYFYGVRMTLRDRQSKTPLTTSDLVDTVRSFLRTILAEADSWSTVPWAHGCDQGKC